MKFNAVIFSVLFSLILCGMTPAAFSQSASASGKDEEPVYLLNEIETLNQIRQLRRELKDLQAQIERAERIIERYEAEQKAAQEAEKKQSSSQ